jgi:hypothetical protein
MRSSWTISLRTGSRPPEGRAIARLEDTSGCADIDRVVDSIGEVVLGWLLEGLGRLFLTVGVGVGKERFSAWLDVRCAGGSDATACPLPERHTRTSLTISL